MKTMEEKLKALKDFAELFNLTPPWSNDIGHWWCIVVDEMELYLLYFFYENNFFADNSNQQIKQMNDLLCQRINKLEAAI